MHTVSSCQFLSGFVWILNMEFCLQKLLIVWTEIDKNFQCGMHGPSDIFSTHCVVVSSLYDRWATTFTASIQDAVIFMAHSFLSPYPRPQLAHCTVLCTHKKVSGMLFQNVQWFQNYVVFVWSRVKTKNWYATLFNFNLQSKKGLYQDD